MDPAELRRKNFVPKEGIRVQFRTEFLKSGRSKLAAEKNSSTSAVPPEAELQPAV